MWRSAKDQELKPQPKRSAAPRVWRIRNCYAAGKLQMTGGNVKGWFEFCVADTRSSGFRFNTMRLYLNELVFLLFAVNGFHVLGAQQQELLIEPIPDWTTSAEIKEYNNQLEKQAH